MPKKLQLITPLDAVNRIPDFEGLPVVAVGIEAPGIAGGLQDALTVDPVVLHQGEDVAVLIVGRIKRIAHEPIDKDELDGAQRRVQVMTVTEASIIDFEAVDGLMADQRSRIEAAVVEAEKREGIHRLPGVASDGDEDDEETVLERQHNAGAHSDGLREGCPLCQLEAEAAADENGTTVEEEFEKRKAQ